MPIRRTMAPQFGLFLSSQFPAEDSLPARLTQLRRQVRAARDAGFWSIWTGSHHLTHPLRSLQAMPLLAFVARDAVGMTLGTNVLVLPLLSPIAVAEEAATLDILTGGHFVLGVGLGYREEEFQAFGIDRSSRVARLTESIGIIRSLFDSTAVNYEGQTIRLDGAGLGARPVRPGGPPIYIAGTVMKAIERSAALGDGLPLDIYLTRKTLREQVERYRAVRLELGLPPGELIVMRECYIGTTTRSAFRDVREAIERKYGAYRAWGQDSFLPPEDQFDQSLEALAPDRFLIGDAASVRDEIQRYRDELGVEHFVFRVHWPGLEDSKAIRTIRLLESEVMSRLG